MGTQVLSINRMEVEDHLVGLEARIRACSGSDLDEENMQACVRLCGEWLAAVQTASPPTRNLLVPRRVQMLWCDKIA
jgi:hypothetical protein